jgi:hypothetical protein
MFAGFLLNDFPLVYISIKSDEVNDENLTLYQNSFINILLRAKSEKQRIIILLDLFQCDNSTFNINNIIKQSSFYKSIMKYTSLYVQHVYILSNRNDLSFFIKIFKKFGKSDVPYKVVKNIQKIEANILKKYNVSTQLDQFKIIDKNLLINSYIYDPNIQNDIIIDNNSIEDENINIEINDDLEEVCEEDDD